MAINQNEPNQIKAQHSMGDFKFHSDMAQYMVQSVPVPNQTISGT